MDFHCCCCLHSFIYIFSVAFLFGYFRIFAVCHNTWSNIDFLPANRSLAIHMHTSWPWHISFWSIEKKNRYDATHTLVSFYLHDGLVFIFCTKMLSVLFGIGHFPLGFGQRTSVLASCECFLFAVLCTFCSAVFAHHPHQCAMANTPNIIRMTAVWIKTFVKIWGTTVTFTPPISSSSGDGMRAKQQHSSSRSIRLSKCNYDKMLAQELILNSLLRVFTSSATPASRPVEESTGSQWHSFHCNHRHLLLMFYMLQYDGTSQPLTQRLGILILLF